MTAPDSAAGPPSAYQREMETHRKIDRWIAEDRAERAVRQKAGEVICQAHSLLNP